MKIYFSGSIRGGRGDVDIYRQIIDHLKQYGQVLTEHVGDRNSVPLGEQTLSEREIHDRDMAWLLAADVIIAEVTTPSIGVGYEIGRAVEHHKKVLCLYRPSADKRLSAMIAGNPLVKVAEYKALDEAKHHIDAFLTMGDMITAVVAIVEHEGKILVGRKITADHFLSGAWHIPGGKQKPGETEEQALVREMGEEAGIRIRVERFLDERFVPENNVRARWYLCNPLTHDIKPGDDLAEACYVPKGEVQKICDKKAVALWPPHVVEYLNEYNE